MFGTRVRDSIAMRRKMFGKRRCLIALITHEPNPSTEIEKFDIYAESTMTLVAQNATYCTVTEITLRYRSISSVISDNWRGKKILIIYLIILLPLSRILDDSRSMLRDAPKDLECREEIT